MGPAILCPRLCVRRVHPVDLIVTVRPLSSCLVRERRVLVKMPLSTGVFKGRETAPSRIITILFIKIRTEKELFIVELGVVLS